MGSGRRCALSASIKRKGAIVFAISTWLRIASACTPLSVRPALCIVTASPVTACTAFSMASCTLGP